MGKISQTTKARISSPFDSSVHKTERSGVAVVMHWMRNIIEQNNLDIGLPDVETGGSDTKFPDTVIYKTRRSKEILCVMEFKPPYFDVFNETELKEPAWSKANKRHSKYFVTSNFRDLILWDTQKVNAQKPEVKQIVNRYHLSEIHDLEFLEQIRYKNSLIKALENFLRDLYEFSIGKKAEPKLAIDELLVFNLQNKIQRLAYYYQDIIYNQAHKDSKFAKDLARWFNGQGWSFIIENEDDYYKAARQTAYLLANKIIFYNALQLKKPDKLPPLSIPEDITQGGVLKDNLQSYFNAVLKIDYETIYTADFIDQLAFPENKEVVEEVKNLIKILQKYNFATLGYDIIGRIFERLIPDQERHNLGQYFTNPDIVDLILKFCLKHEDDKIIDPSCGAGTFLVRAYQHKKILNKMLSHEKILSGLWGNDIAKFPAHLATINLAINDLSVEENYPNIIQKDFFDLIATPQGFELPENIRKAKLKLLGNREKEVIYPKRFDALVGNPPYTRQEEISEMSSGKTYKKELIDKALNYGNNKIADISKRAGIYVYFFIHGTKFLKNSGRFGFIVSNAWLDVEYGAGLQEFFLKNYKIIAILESKVERWFEDADINTCVVILEKESGKEFSKQRDENLVRFAYLFKPLRYFIPAAKDIWEQEVKRLDKIDGFIKTILAHSDFYENDDLRIFPKKQSELWDEGFDKKEDKYIGSKWGKYLRAPKIFFKILEKGRDKLVPLKQIADVRRGFTTGANEFFYVEDVTDEIEDITFIDIKPKIKNLGKYRTLEKIKRDNLRIVKNSKSGAYWLIEDEFLKPVIKSPRECKSIVVNPKDLKFKVLMVNKERQDLRSTKVFKYIRWGEERGFNKRPTCASRKSWWGLGKQTIAAIIQPMIIYERHIVSENNKYFNDANLVGIYPEKSIFEEPIKFSLISTFSDIFREINGIASLGEGAFKANPVYMKQIFTLKYLSEKHKSSLNKILSTIGQRNIRSVFEELGAKNSKDVSLDKVKPDRRELDKIVMGEILGLSDAEQLEVYQAVIDLVKSRIEKAKSFGKKQKTKTGIDIDKLVNIILEKIGNNTLGKFYKEKILSQQDLTVKKLPEFKNKPEIKKGLFGWQLISGKNSIDCNSETQAQYLKIWLEAGAQFIKLPKDEEYLEKITNEIKKLKSNIDQIIEDYLGYILDQKLKNQILHQVWQVIIKD
ncbi:MAG: N-6 DNA methylase [bacterium]